MTHETETTNDKPVNVVRDGNIKITIWENEGENGKFYTCIPARTYKVKDTTDLKDGNSFTGTELLRLSHLSLKAYDWVQTARAANKLRAEAEALKNPDTQNQT